MHAMKYTLIISKAILFIIMLIGVKFAIKVKYLYDFSPTLREERKLRVFKNKVLRRVFGPKRDELKGNGENYITRSLVICIFYPKLCGW